MTENLFRLTVWGLSPQTQLIEQDEEMRSRCPEYFPQARRAEEAFRRGYHYAVSDVIDFLQDHEALGLEELLKSLIDYHDGPAWKWHYNIKHLGHGELPPTIKPSD